MVPIIVGIKLFSQRIVNSVIKLHPNCLSEPHIRKKCSVVSQIKLNNNKK